MSTAQKKSGPRALISRMRAYLHTQNALRLLICVLTVFVTLLLFMAAISPVRYDLKVGMVPTNTIAATKDVVDEITTEKKRAEAAAAVSPSYKYQEGITENVLNNLDQVFAQLRAVRQYGDTLPDASDTRVYTEEELAYAKTMLSLLALKDYQITTLLHTPSEDLESLYSSLYAATANSMNGHVTQGQESEAVQSILQIIGFRIDPSLLQNVALPVLNFCIQPNMIIDQDATEKARSEASSAVEDVIYKQGQNIVVKGEGRITANQIAMLSALGLLSDESVDMMMYLGGALLVLAVTVVLLLLLHRPDFEAFQDTTRLLITCITFVLSLGLCILARLINIYLMPVTLCALLLTTLVGMRTGVACGAALAILTASLAAGGSEAYAEQTVLVLTTGLVSGMVASLMMQDKSSRLRALLAGLLVAASNFTVILSFGLMTSSDVSGTIANGLWTIAGAFVGVLLYIAIQPLMEMIFNLPTPLKLLELSNPNQPLMRRLLMEAPGTYHHSIIVANLAEAAAEAIGAKALLARVGGYYHDVGKLKRPLYFRENQMNDVNAHDHTDPQVSAAIVTAHVRDGVAMAHAYRLPQEVINIIAEHHGDTPVMFFYHKALQQAGGKPVDIDAFRYDGHPPTTKESAIVMLCDTIEAAVRTMKSPTPESIENFIVKLVRGKLEDGQLSNAPLTLRDIDLICAACTTVLVGVFHERIEYPDVPEKKPRLHVPTVREKEEADEEKEQEAESEEGPVIVPQPVLEPLPLVSPEPAEEPVPLVTPETTGEPPVITPPPSVGPIQIDDLLSLQEFNDKTAEPLSDEEEITLPEEPESKPEPEEGKDDT